MEGGGLPLWQLLHLRDRTAVKYERKGKYVSGQENTETKASTKGTTSVCRLEMFPAARMASSCSAPYSRQFCGSAMKTASRTNYRCTCDIEAIGKFKNGGTPLCSAVQGAKGHRVCECNCPQNLAIFSLAEVYAEGVGLCNIQDQPMYQAAFVSIIELPTCSSVYNLFPLYDWAYGCSCTPVMVVHPGLEQPLKYRRPVWQCVAPRTGSKTQFDTGSNGSALWSRSTCICLEM